MPYQYHFDSTRAGDLQLRTADFLILQEAYGLLREELDGWNRRALENGAANSPYELEVGDLTRMIEWGNQRQDQARIGGVIVQGASVGTLRYVKAALMLMISKGEKDHAEKERARWPTAVLRSLTDRIDKVRKFAADINYEPNDVLWELIPKETETPEDRPARAAEWDVFISQASEDKEAFVRPLAEGLAARGVRVWFDEFTITIGDSLRQSIDLGLARSRFGVVVISPNFLRKGWPKKELDGLVAREIDGMKVILPVWHEIGVDGVRASSPTLADRVAASSDNGLDHVIEEVIRAIRRDDKPQAGIGHVDTLNASAEGPPIGSDPESAVAQAASLKISVPSVQVTPPRWTRDDYVPIDDDLAVVYETNVQRGLVKLKFQSDRANKNEDALFLLLYGYKLLLGVADVSVSNLNVSLFESGCRKEANS